MKLLIKQSFKTIFGNKIFSLILMIIIFISSLTYTLLQSSTNAFQDSYNNLVHNGNLHDLVAKELYNNQGHLELEIIPKEVNKNEYWVQLKAASGDYLDYFNANPQEKKWAVTFDSKFRDQELAQAKLNIIIERQEFLEKKVHDEKPLAFQKAIDEIYHDQLTSRHTESIAVFANNQAFKFVKEDTDSLINKLVIYDGTSTFTNPLSDEAMNQELQSRAQQVFGQEGSYTTNKLKGYRWTAQAFSDSVWVTDPSAFQAIISPSFANLNNKRAITPQEVLRLYEKYNNFDDINENEELKRNYANNLVWVDKTPYFIIGIGVTPDFSFPIIDQSRPIPIPQDEAIIYTNKRGYERIVDGFRNNPRENYFSFKYKANLAPEHKKVIMSEIEDLARNGKDSLFSKGYNGYLPSMGWPSNIKIVTEYNDTNHGIILVEQRIAFLQNLKQTINVLTISTTSFLIIFVSSIVVLIFKALLAIRRIKNATLMALGYSKKAIATSISLAAIMLVGLPSTFGYIFGYFLQYPFINIFAQYWTIPTYGSSFSIISLIITVIIPITLIFVMIFVLTSWDLNEKLTNMLRGKSKYKFSVVQTILKPFVWVDIKTKYVTSLMISNIGRLILSTLAGIVSVSAIIVGISSVGRAEYAYDQTVNASNYTFQTNFASPTAEGGQYQTINYCEAIKRIGAQKVDEDGIHWHIPSMADAPLAITNFILDNEDSDWDQVRTFLKNKLQFKPLLDVTIGGSINSWEIAKKLMPDNQRNSAESNEIEFYKLATMVKTNQDWKNLQDQRNEEIPWWPQEEKGWKVSSVTKMEQDGMSLRQDFIDFVKNGLWGLSQTDADFIPYIISYNVVISDKDDEKYTYINTSINQKNYNIIGVRARTNHFKLSDVTWDKLANYGRKNYAPLIINKYIAEKHNLSIGSSLSLPVTNHVNRNIEGHAQDEFEVIDIVNTYDDDRLITRQEDANKIIGLDLLGRDPFNGLFTSQTKPVALNVLPLYSEADFYIGTDTITDDWYKIVEKIIHKLHGDSHLKNINSAQDLINIYSKTPYVGMFNKIVWNKMTNSTFFNISQLASSIIWIIQIISIILSILFAIIVSSLLITSNSKKIATLWTLGYRRSEVMRMFSLIYLLPIILSIVIGIPIATGVLAALRVFVINFGAILIPFALAWWAIILALLFIGTIFILSTVISIMTIKNEQARKTIQE